MSIEGDKKIKELLDKIAYLSKIGPAIEPEINTPSEITKGEQERR